jgi:multiple antibiotic resistance protein
VIWTNPAEIALTQFSSAPIVRFSLLALSSIFFLVDPFAAIPSFLAITHDAEPLRRKHVARKGALTCFIVLTSFAVAGQLIFRLFGITLPAFEIAGGLILLLIGLEMRPRRMQASCPSESLCLQAPAPSRPSWCWLARCPRSGIGRWAPFSHPLLLPV